MWGLEEEGFACICRFQTWWIEHYYICTRHVPLDQGYDLVNFRAIRVAHRQCKVLPFRGKLCVIAGRYCAVDGELSLVIYL